jgi:hypothetical protein
MTTAVATFWSLQNVSVRVPCANPKPGAARAPAVTASAGVDGRLDEGLVGVASEVFGRSKDGGRGEEMGRRKRRCTSR